MRYFWATRVFHICIAGIFAQACAPFREEM